MVTVVVRMAEEALPLLQLALKISSKMESKFSVVLLDEDSKLEQTSTIGDCSPWIQELDIAPEVKATVFGSDERYENAEAYLRSHQPSLLILGKHLHAKAETEDTKFSRKIYNGLACQTLLVRLGDQVDNPFTLDKHNPLPDEDEARAPILVACGNGSHTRRALRLAHMLSGTDTVAFHISPDVDPESAAFAKQSITKIVKKAGIDPAGITCKTALTTDLPKALREVVGQGHEGHPYAMLILGESQTRGLREKLFGTVPDILINKSDGLTIGVIHAEKPVGTKIKKTISRVVRVKLPQLERGERLALFEEIVSKSRWSFDFAALMTLAALVAGLGLLADSGAVVIGAMLLAPLMMPLIGSGLALAQGNFPLFKSALNAVVRGFLFALVTGFVLGVVARYFQIPLTDELAARGNPTLLDLGVAFVSGIAASYCIARPNLSGALAGVAIAAALVPPIATVGISITMGHMAVAKGASLLFGTNVVCVILGAALNFMLAGIRGQGKAGDTGRRLMIVLALCCLGLAVPLTSVLVKKIKKLPQIEELVDSALGEEALSLAVKSVLGNKAELVSVRRIASEEGSAYTLEVEHVTPIDEMEYQQLLSKVQALAGVESITLKTSTKLIRR